MPAAPAGRDGEGRKPTTKEALPHEKPRRYPPEAEAYISKLLSELSDRLANGPDHNHGDFLGFASDGGAMFWIDD